MVVVVLLVCLHVYDISLYAFPTSSRRTSLGSRVGMSLKRLMVIVGRGQRKKNGARF